MSPTLLTTVITALVSAGLGAVGAYVALRKDKREAHDAENAEVDRTIMLLEKQNDLLERQNLDLKAMMARREAEFLQQREAWDKREERLESRIETLERWQRDELAARTRLQMCRNAPDCQNYNPGEPLGD